MSDRADAAAGLHRANGLQPAGGSRPLASDVSATEISLSKPLQAS